MSEEQPAAGAQSESGESVEANQVILDIEKKITDAFLVFDTADNKQVDVRELGTVVRSLGLCPTEREVNELVSMTEDETSTGNVRLERLLPVLTKVMLEKKYRSQPETVLMQAFETLDLDNKGYLLPNEISKYFKEEGEPFCQEELEEFLSAAVDPTKGKIFYRDYVALLAVDESGL
jgi:Ca2+-binding EF-hand superfamily protein